MAVTTINLTTASIEVDKFNGTLSAKESGALSAYNSDMKKLIKKVKKLPDYNSETYYIMLVERSDDQTLGGFMPVNSNFGFVFAKANSGKEQLNRTIAHELAHGAFRLWHTFSSENLYTAPQGTTNNLMDYNGTAAELYKYQWDYIHNPQQGIVRWMVEEDEGESQITSDPICTQKFIEAFRYAYANNKTLTYEKDGWPYAGHFAKDLKLLDDVIYKELYVSVLQDLGAKVSDRRITPKKQNGQSVYTLGSVLTIATNDNFDKFDSYLYPDYDEWNQQMNGFVKQISALSERSKILESLSILPAPLCERLDFQTRAKFLKTISNGMVMEGYTGCVNDEEALINLVGNVPNDQIKNLFDELSANNLMQTLRSGIDNFGGDDNYSIFCAALLKTYMAAYNNKLQDALNAYDNKSLDYQIFVWNKNRTDDRRLVKYRQEYKNNKIVVETWIGDRFSTDTHVHTRTVDPFEIIILSCHTAPTHVPEIKENTALAMPGFMLEWFLNEKDNKNIMKAADLATSFLVFCKAAKILAKTQRLLDIADMIFATGNLALQNDAIEDYFKSINEKTKNENEQGLLDIWNTVSNLWNYKSPISSLIRTKSIDAFDSFVILWNEYKKTSDFQTCPEEIKTTIDQLINEVKSIEDEETK